MATQAPAWREHLIRAQIARSLAFKGYLTLLRGREFSSEFPRRLLSFFDAVNDGVTARLEALRADPAFQDLRDDAAEAHLVRHSALYQFLYSVTSDLEHVETSRTIIEFSHPLQRLVLPRFRNVRLLLHALPEVNYSWADPVSPLMAIARQLEISIDVRPPSGRLWSIGFPGLQPGQTLVHALLSHELGHGIFQSASLLPSLRRHTKVPPERLNAVVRAAAAAGPIPRTVLRRALRRYTNALLGEWLEEIACDIIGYMICGPAFLFASIHFLPALAELDSPSEEYPPIRLRLSLLFRLLKGDLGYPIDQVCTATQYKEWFLEEGAARFLSDWDQHITAFGPGYADDPWGIVAQTVDQSFARLLGAVRSKMERLKTYNFTEHKDQIRQLVDRLAFSVPPNELDQPPGAVADAVCILNAGWIAYLSLVEPLSTEHGWDEWTTRSKIEEWVAKALELQEIQRRWAEVLPEDG